MLPLLNPIIWEGKKPSTAFKQMAWLLSNKTLLPETDGDWTWPTDHSIPIFDLNAGCEDKVPKKLTHSQSVEGSV